MKKQILSLTLPLAITLGAVSSAYAGHHEKGCGVHQVNMERMHHKLLSKLDLNDATEAEAKQIMAAGQEQHMLIRQQARKQMNALHESQIKKLSSLLSAEEVEKMEQFHREHAPHKKMDCNMGGNKGKR
ncbi:MAG: Spy/CpxP family protein refolding chaperone [Lentisphaeria bacterium]|jgi:Spy/CpxP family protein refolding chaperone